MNGKTTFKNGKTIEMNGKTTFKNGKTTLSSWCSCVKALSSGFTGTIVPVAVVACFINFIFGPGTAILDVSRRRHRHSIIKI